MALHLLKVQYMGTTSKSYWSDVDRFCIKCGGKVLLLQSEGLDFSKFLCTACKTAFIVTHVQAIIGVEEVV